jgi:hypothetical protein
VRHQLDAGGLHEVEDAGAIALTRLDQAHLLQGFDGLAQGGAVDTELLSELALRGELVPGGIASFQDERAQLLDDLFRDALLADRS